MPNVYMLFKEAAPWHTSRAEFRKLVKRQKKQATKLCLQIFEKLSNINCILLKIKDFSANTVDPDEAAHYEPSHLDLQCLQIQL